MNDLNETILPIRASDLSELKESLDICVSLLEAARSNHLPRITAAYNKANSLLRVEICDCPAKDMPFGRCCKAKAIK